jgi:hypothetical protein
MFRCGREAESSPVENFPQSVFIPQFESGSAIAVPEAIAIKRLLPVRGPPRQVLVAKVEVKSHPQHRQ